MKQAILAALAVAVLWTALPLLLASAQAPAGHAAAAAETGPAGTEETSPASEPETQASFDEGFLLAVQTPDGVREMDLQNYLTGALLAEMPARFAPEAKKAQAVAIRTYALRACSSGRHPDAAVCTDSACCLGWKDPAEAPAEARAAALDAVRATDALTVCYRGELIDATFFSCSGGRTEAAAAVWGSDLPYLQAVDSPGEEDAPHDTDRVAVDLEEFCARLRREDPQVCFPEAVGAWVGALTRTAGGGVDRIELGGRVFTGKQLRKLFSLRSTAFTLELGETQAVFTTRGYGHRVGLSQYGAEAMAKAGKGFEEILLWYYQGVALRRADE